jgi:hypothetical protein
MIGVRPEKKNFGKSTRCDVQLQYRSLPSQVILLEIRLEFDREKN